MDKKTFMWITFIGFMRINVKNSLKYLAIMIALMDNFNTGTGEQFKIKFVLNHNDVIIQNKLRRNLL